MTSCGFLLALWFSYTVRKFSSVLWELMSLTERLFSMSRGLFSGLIEFLCPVSLLSQGTSMPYPVPQFTVFSTTFTSGVLPIFAGKWIINNSCAFLCACLCKWVVADCTLISCSCTCFNSRSSTILIPEESLYTWYLFTQDGSLLLKSEIAYDMLDLSVEHLFSMITS